jgi:hypothetical protein
VTLYVLSFVICTAAADPHTGARGCEQGDVTHRSCAMAEEYVRAGLRPGQVLHVSGCEVVE